MPVREGPMKEPQVTRQAPVGANIDQLKDYGFKQTFAFRLRDVGALARGAMDWHSRTF